MKGSHKYVGVGAIPIFPVGAYYSLFLLATVATVPGTG